MTAWCCSSITGAGAGAGVTAAAGTAGAGAAGAGARGQYAFGFLVVGTVRTRVSDGTETSHGTADND